jgi:hypothetical protein
MAERVGFEPTVGCPTHAFQACAFDRSAISPGIGRSGREDRASNRADASTNRLKIAQTPDPAKEFRHLIRWIGAASSADCFMHGLGARALMNSTSLGDAVLLDPSVTEPGSIRSRPKLMRH